MEWFLEMARKEIQTLMARGSADLGVPLGEREIGHFFRYLSLLEKWNARINLSAARSDRELVAQHLLDSLAVVPHVPGDAARAVDVGSGAGFPGAVVAIMRPAVEVVALEPVHKKQAFLATVRRELGLENFRPLAQRLADHMQEAGYRPYDVAMSRATFALPRWLAEGAALVHESGVVLGMEGAEQHDLPAGAQRLAYGLPAAEHGAATRTRAVVVFRPGGSAGLPA